LLWGKAGTWLQVGLDVKIWYEERNYMLLVVVSVVVVVVKNIEARQAKDVDKYVRFLKF
jgi:hypothetical protein